MTSDSAIPRHSLCLRHPLSKVGFRSDFLRYFPLVTDTKTQKDNHHILNILNIYGGKNHVHITIF